MVAKWPPSIQPEKEGALVLLGCTHGSCCAACLYRMRIFKDLRIQITCKKNVKEWFFPPFSAAAGAKSPAMRH